MLGGKLAVLQAPVCDGLSLDPFALFDDGLGPAEVGICRRHIVQALVVASMVVMLDERRDLGVKVARQEVVFESGCGLPASTFRNAGTDPNYIYAIFDDVNPGDWAGVSTLFAYPLHPG